MKKKYYSLDLVNHPFKVLIISLKTQINLLIFVILLLTGFTSLSQDKVSVINFNELSSEKSVASQSDKDLKNVKSLAVDLHPSVYLAHGEIKFYHDNPITAFLDIQAFNSPITSDPRFASVELLSISINQNPVLNNININNLKAFPSLKYIFIECNFECNENQLRSAFASLSNNYTIIYRVEILN